MLWLLQKDGLEVELKTLRGTGGAGFYQAMPLPEGMAVSNAELIAILNEHLVVALQVHTTFYITTMLSVIFE